MTVEYQTDFKEISHLFLQLKFNHYEYELFKKAYLFAKKKHAGQKRMSGEPFLVHLTATAFFLIKWKMPSEIIITGLLHDVLEDTDTNVAEIESHFGKNIAQLTEYLTKVTSFSKKHREVIDYHYLYKIYLGMSHDIRIIFVKLADRLHNLLTINFLPLKKQKIIAQESNDVYALIAERLGMSFISNIYRDLCFQIMHPQHYQELKKWLQIHNLDNQKIIKNCIAQIKNVFRKQGLVVSVTGRIKEIYSIYKKILLKGKNIESLYDILAVRVITNNINDCYSALGFLHQYFVSITSLFKDYITVPKTNLYQSLHTVIILPSGHHLEIQIRTRHMDYFAEYGLGAHWQYKLKKPQNKVVLSKNKFPVTKILGDDHPTEKSNTDVFSHKMMELLQKEIKTNVFAVTPQKKVIILPVGACIIDFAYRIHSLIGDRVTGALVNGNAVKVNYMIHSGDVIKIITNNKQHPQEQWLSWVKTQGAKTKIKKYLYKKKIILIQKVVPEDNKVNQEISLQKKSDFFWNDLKKNEINLFYKWYKLPLKLKNSFLQTHQLFFNDYFKKKINHKQQTKFIKEKITPYVKDSIEKLSVQQQIKKNIFRSDVLIEDMSVMFSYKIARCCFPIYGEPIAGFLNLNQKIIIHRLVCHNIKEKQQSDLGRVLNAKWNSQNYNLKSYLTKIMVYVKNIPFLLDRISVFWKKNNIIVENIRFKKNKHQADSVLYLTLRMRNIDQLNQFANYLSNFESVSKFSRMLN